VEDEGGDTMGDKLLVLFGELDDDDDIDGDDVGEEEE
jgi:hypothetical protein